MGKGVFHEGFYYFIGMNQAGLAELIRNSIEKCPKEIQPCLWENIVLIGGNAKFRGMKERL
jgi:actin-related protein